MRREMVMSEEEVLERRRRIKRKRLSDAPAELSPQQEEAIEELLRGHRSTFDSAFSRFSGFRPMDRVILSVHESSQKPHVPSSPATNSCTTTTEPDTDPRMRQSPAVSSSSFGFYGVFKKQESVQERDISKSSVFTALPHIMDLTTYMIQDIINFSKSLRTFRALTMGDQISLLKGATFEIMQIRFNMVFNTKTSIWECGHIAYCIDDAVRAGFQQLLLEPLFKFHHTLRKLGLQEEEYVLVQALTLFSPDRPGVQHRDVVDELQENLALTLKAWIDCKRTDPDKHLLFPRLIACLTEMRTMTEEYSKQVLQIQDLQPEDISPLIMEVVSKSPCSDV
ncbi:nuclear receptor subfamily 1 group I member 2 isoform X2 [Betta splendens]|nr:nuclear receptor subfamily 1 group I member 2 isoform X2 [Betta splendens]